MTKRDRIASFNASLQILIDRLASSPWDLSILKEVWTLGLRRTASGVLAPRKVKVQRTGDIRELLDTYRQLAWHSPNPATLSQIVRLSQEMMPRLDPRSRNAAEQVEVWATNLLRRLFNTKDQG